MSVIVEHVSYAFLALSSFRRYFVCVLALTWENMAIFGSLTLPSEEGLFPLFGKWCSLLPGLIPHHQESRVDALAFWLIGCCCRVRERAVEGGGRRHASIRLLLASAYLPAEAEMCPGPCRVGSESGSGHRPERPGIVGLGPAGAGLVQLAHAPRAGGYCRRRSL